MYPSAESWEMCPLASLISQTPSATRLVFPLVNHISQLRSELDVALGGALVKCKQ